MLKKNILPFLSFFGLLLLCQFWRLKDPFFNDELIYSINNFQNARFSIFIPFSGSYVSHTGHSPFLPFLSFLVFKSGVPFIPGLRIIYLLFSSFFLFSFFETLQLITKNKKASLLGVLLLFCCLSLKKIEKEKRLAFIMLSSLFLPYLIFFGLYGDTQTRDFFLLLPITTTLIVLTMEIFSQQWKKILLVCFILFYQAFDFNKVQDKETRKFRKTYESYQEVLSFLENNPTVKNNLKSQFPYKLIFKEKEFGVLQGRAPIQSGSELYVVLETEEKSDSLFEVKVFKNSNKRIAIKLVR